MKFSLKMSVNVYQQKNTVQRSNDTLSTFLPFRRKQTTTWALEEGINEAQKVE